MCLGAAIFFPIGRPNYYAFEGQKLEYIGLEGAVLRRSGRIQN